MTPGHLAALCFEAIGAATVACTFFLIAVALFGSIVEPERPQTPEVPDQREIEIAELEAMLGREA